jgi:alpha-mannosidase
LESFDVPAVPGGSFVTVSSPDVLVLGLKPAEDGNGWIVRLFGASGKDSKVKLGWASAAPITQWLSDSNEQRGAVGRAAVFAAAASVIPLTP